MSDRHFSFWPKGQPRSMSVPATSLFYNAEVSAARYPDKPYLVFYDSTVSFAVNQRPLPTTSRMMTVQITAPMTNRPSLK